jgi:hypothetical protein
MKTPQNTELGDTMKTPPNISGLSAGSLPGRSVAILLAMVIPLEAPLTDALSTLSLIEVEVNLRPTVSRPVCLGVRRPSGTCDQFSFLLEIPFRHLRVCYFVAPSLTRGRVCNLL